jgi:hypothetical protein
MSEVNKIIVAATNEMSSSGFSLGTKSSTVVADSFSVAII